MDRNAVQGQEQPGRAAAAEAAQQHRASAGGPPRHHPSQVHRAEAGQQAGHCAGEDAQERGITGDGAVPPDERSLRGAHRWVH